jgi:error-prone DNA polymerase
MPPPRRTGSDYVELHAHSAFSFLDGASSPEEMAAHAAELGHRAMALTDHDGLSGSLAFAHAARAAGVRPITGAELTLEDGAHLTLLAESGRGYANLCRLITLAHAGTRPPPRRQARPPVLPRAALAAHSEGLVCLTGCAREGVAARALSEGGGAAVRVVEDLVRDFGPGNVWVEIQRPRMRGDRRLMRDLHLDDIELVVAPITREADGLAMSSRNVYLGPEDRTAAVALHRGLAAAAGSVAGGERSGEAIEGAAAAVISAEPRCELDYVALIDPDTFRRLPRLVGPAILAVAARVGPARLIDNILLPPPATE